MILGFSLRTRCSSAQRYTGGEDRTKICHECSLHAMIELAVRCRTEVEA
jgi:hypothetical protein